MSSIWKFEVRRNRPEPSEASGLYCSPVAFDRSLAPTRQVKHDVRGISEPACTRLNFVIDKHQTSLVQSTIFQFVLPGRMKGVQEDIVNSSFAAIPSCSDSPRITL